MVDADRYFRSFPINRMVWFRDSYKNDPAFRRLFASHNLIANDPYIQQQSNPGRKLIAEATLMWNYFKANPGYTIHDLIRNAYAYDKAEFLKSTPVQGGYQSVKLQPVITAQSGKSWPATTPASDIANKLRGGWLSDIVIKLNGTGFNVHKDMITKCAFFKAALSGNFAHELEFEIYGASGLATLENINIIMDQLYGVKIAFNGALPDIAELYSIAKYIGFDEMADVLRTLLEKVINESADFDRECTPPLLEDMSIFSREQVIFLCDEMPLVYYLAEPTSENYFPSELEWLWLAKREIGIETTNM